MFFLKFNALMVLVIFLLSLKGLYSPSGDSENLDLTLSLSGESSDTYQRPASQTPETDKKQKPQQVVQIIEDRKHCLEEIRLIFAEDASPDEHIRHAFKSLTLTDQGLPENAKNYYQTFFRYAFPAGDLVLFWDYFYKFPVESRGDEQIYHPDSLRRLWNGPNLGEVLHNTLYFINEEIVNATENNCFIGYFELILSNLDINLNPPLLARFKGPLEFCKSQFSMPAKYKKWDIDTDLRL